MKTPGVTQLIMLLGLCGFVLFALAAPAKLSHRIKAGKREFVVELADTRAKKRQGLMNRDFMPVSQGLLMIFDHEKRVPIWMKNMRFSIDVAWLSSDGMVIDLRTLPACKGAPCEVFYPIGPARFVLEVGAGLFPLNRGDKVEIIDATGDSLLRPVSGTGKYTN